MILDKLGGWVDLSFIKLLQTLERSKAGQVYLMEYTFQLSIAKVDFISSNGRGRYAAVAGH